MKKILLTVIVAIFAISAASAQDKGNWAIGPKLSLYNMKGGTAYGISAAGRYSFTDNWRIEPAVTAFFTRGAGMEINCDAQYVFNLNKGWGVYPLAGIAFNPMNTFTAGLNIGAGADYAVAPNWDLSLNLKWQPLFVQSGGSFFIVSIGGFYKF